jgi:hypothetical protein
VAWRGGEEPKLRAEGGPQDDSDGDGLCDGLELVLGTRVDRADTDGDGWSDAEEIARGSNPRRAHSMPGDDSTGLKIDAYLDRGLVHAVTVIYLPDGNPRGKVLNFGTIAGNGIVPVPLHQLRGGEGVRSVATRSGRGRVYVLDPVVSARSVQIKGGFSLCATLAQAGNYLAADAVNLTVVNGEIFEQVILGYHTPVPDPDLNVGLGIGGVYRPIQSGSGTAAYSQGEICAQTTVIVGVVGALVTQEVVSANCVPGWDAHCSPGCSATIGSTLKTIDPATLIGG